MMKRCGPWRHKWRIIGKSRVERRGEFGGLRLFTYYALRCERCGRIRGKRVRGWMNDDD